MKRNKLSQFFGRLITAIIILSITALILTVFDFLISTFTSLFTHPIIKGIIGFVLCAITLYIVQYIVTGYSISWISALLGALVYAIVDYMLPAEEENQRRHIHHATI